MMEAKPPQSLNLQQEAANEKTSGARLERLALNSPYLARLVASNPSAPPALLHLLAFSGDAATRKNVAANPNTPTEILLYLGAEFPEELLNNPVFSLFFLENPRLLQEMPPATLASLVQLETVPVSFFEPAANRDEMEVLLALANSPTIPLAILKRLADSRYEMVRLAVRFHVKFSGDIALGWEAATRKQIGDIYFSPHKRISERDVSLYKEGREILEVLGARPEEFKSLPEIVRRFPSIATNPNTPVSVLKELALDRDSEVRSLVAKNPNTPVSLLVKLAKDSDAWVRSWVATNPKTPVSWLVQLAKDSDSWVRKKVAANPKTPVRLLVKLATDIYSSVVREVAANPQTPARLLVGLAKDSYSRVSKELASNPNTPVFILALLAKESVMKLRKRVAVNPNTSASLLVKLALDSDLEVRSQVAKNPNTPASVLVELGKSNSTVRTEVASNPNTPVSLLEQLVKNDDRLLRPEVASNPNTPVSLLVQLAEDSSSWVRYTVASNPNTPVSLLERLVKDNHWSVRQKVASNPNTPVSVLEQLLGNLEEFILEIAVGRYLAKNPDGLSVVLQHYPKDSYFYIRYSRLFILLHPQVPSHVLAEHSRSLWWWERYAVTQHPNTPPETLKRLAGDANRLVRAAARANLQNRQIEA